MNDGALSLSIAKVQIAHAEITFLVHGETSSHSEGR